MSSDKYRPDTAVSSFPANPSSKRKAYESDNTCSDNVALGFTRKISKSHSSKENNVIFPTSSSKSQSESSILEMVIPEIASKWTEHLFPDLRIQVTESTFTPYSIFESYLMLVHDAEKRLSVQRAYYYNYLQSLTQEQQERITKFKLLQKALEEDIDLDIECIEDVSIPRILRLHKRLKEYETSLDACSHCEPGRLSLEIKIYLREFVWQLLYMAQNLKKSETLNREESLNKGMFQELFIRFIKIFELEIVSVPNIVDREIKIGSTTVTSTPDSLVLHPERDENSVLAVVEVRKEYSSEKSTEKMRKLSKDFKPVNHINANLKGQHVGEMLSLLPESIFGPSGIYGFIVQGTEVTVVALLAEKNYLEYIQKRSFPQEDYVGATVKYSESCNILTRKGRSALMQTLYDMAVLHEYV